MKDKIFIHSITNYVTIYDVAATIKACGVYPIMADSSNETYDITKNVDGLYVNIGMLNNSKERAIINSISSANKNDLPIVLDPTGIGMSKYRRAFFIFILKKAKKKIVKGNLSEILSIYENKKSHGVDNEDDLEEDEKIEILKELSIKYSGFFVLTGKNNIATDGINIINISGGAAILKDVVGSGCMLGGIISAFCGIDFSFESVKKALEISRDASIRAFDKNKNAGIMEFLNNYIDEIYKMRREEKWI